MNRLRLIKTSYTALSALMLAACANDELTDGPVQDLPEGAYPLQISSVTMSAESTAQPWDANAPQTRVSENTNGNSSEWNEGDEITVQLSGTMADNTSYTAEGKYTVGSDKTSLSSVSGKELYWHSTSEGTVTAWYCNPAAASDNTVNLSDQSNGLAYVLFTTPQKVQYGATDTKLAFAHKLAKIRVKFTGGSYGINKVEVSTYTSCKINPADGTLTNLGSEGYIPMCKTTYNDGVYWEANVVPGGYEINKVRLNGNKECTITKSVTPVEAAKYYTMKISVTGGAYYPDELPEITDDGEYTISGTGTKTITINGGSPKITLKDINITTDESCIHIQNGSPIITLEGTNKLKLPENFISYKKPLLWLAGESANVTIQGDGELEIDATVGGSWNNPAIGSTIYGKCGNITILGSTIKAYASSTAGIGSGMFGSCGNITIKNATVDVKGNPAIGASRMSSFDDQTNSCGNILIENTNLTANFFEQARTPGVDIGCGGSNSGGTISCGTITISHTAKTRAEILEGIKGGNPLIGKGKNTTKGTSSCGLITITGSDGTQTYSGDTGVTNN
ncbi:fimbrillin family protein [Bacteroides fragilis]|uniref:Fimbrillin family protein n=1 Tax=Bacteroides fragilis TaxID=817 RepID=A0A853PNK3_BACFG|nr:fimbrillin family protein [Bacteroides fragilis]MCS2359387.1 fimbrillin family protein [Bacteroides fragilis]OCR29013.1 hypothetical protein AC094_34420 [Bacteroides fragilis]PJY65793.1 hypothetical protein CQW35_02155 [Bacteroides fragilis]